MREETLTQRESLRRKWEKCATAPRAPRPPLTFTFQRGATDGGAGAGHSHGARGPQRRRADIPRVLPRTPCDCARITRCASRAELARGLALSRRKRVASVEVAQAPGKHRALLRAPTPWIGPVKKISQPILYLGNSTITPTAVLLSLSWCHYKQHVSSNCHH
ncbi:unnamed protein product [Danaus chrysippus]|uniref:(African queen) hypothetical protein n=1 Tax=Danaus chrysippus TaxID=151541 RepID=A0A8J2R402_9NEOP|nr:unnamed protein product [Danaus chrysippus]